MKIKTKLTISFCIIIFVPLLLAGLTLCGLSRLQGRIVEENYGITNSGAYSLTNSLQILNRYTKEDFEQMENTARQEPAKLEDEEWLKTFDETLKGKYSYLVIRKGEEVIFNGGTDNASVLDSLGAYNSSRVDSQMAVYLDSDEGVLVKQMELTFADGTDGSGYIISSTQQVVPEIRWLYVEIVVAIVIILILTALMLVAWTYGSIITPLRKLQDGAEKIKEGCLDFTIDVSGDDEIGELGMAFEQMRQHLKENAEDKLDSERENRALISNIAHDLKTPITAVKGYAEGIMDGVANTPEKVDKYVRTIYNKATEMDTLINELTLCSKIDTNRIPYNFAKLTAADYFGDCVEELGLDLESKGIMLAYYNYAPDDVVIIADPEQMRRAINNIIGNSVKYMNKQNGFINIRVKDVGDFIQVEIEDNGRGIAQKDLPYIFDRFYRADASRNSATGGSGIGLSIVSKIIEDHGGKIWATSREGIGTIMYFVIRKFLANNEEGEQ